MNSSKIIKGVSALVFLGVSVILVFLMVQELKNGLGSIEKKGFLAMYAALLVYALFRVFVLLKDVFRK